jgi:cyclopropane-fatty-acyl-phospholipid synthase
MNTWSKTLENDYAVRDYGDYRVVRQAAQDFLAPADVRIDGDREWDISVVNPEFFTRVLSGGSLALGESYMDGWWYCGSLDQFFYKILRAELENHISFTWGLAWSYIKSKLLNLQAPSRAYTVGEVHYDIGNDLYRNMLDKRMIYSCGYWEKANTLDKAQEAKLELICRKTGLRKGMRVLDIGCGWGGFVKYAAEKYGVEAVGITISQEQAKLASESCAGLPVEIRLQDYRELDERFDAVVSVGMFEHVGYKNYREYMSIVNKCLEPCGLFLLHTIGCNKSTCMNEPWLDKYIFPNGMTPSSRQITEAAEGLFVMEDWHNIGINYDKTLMAWHENFTENWDSIKGSYDQRFYRMWSYYLLMCAGSFRARKNQVWQVLFSKKGIEGGCGRFR